MSVAIRKIFTLINSSSVRQTVLLLGLLMMLLDVAVMQAEGAAPERFLYQSSPLSPLSPLATPSAQTDVGVPTTRPASPVSLALVALVLAGVLMVVGLVIWRQR